MKLRLIFLGACAGVTFAATELSAADATPANGIVSSAPIYVPDFSHSGDPIPDGVLEWSSLMQTTNAAADQESVRFTFSFKNAAKRADIALVTNLVTAADSTIQTNVTTITNFTPVSVAIGSVHASCGCTQPELPPLPWVIPPGGQGEFAATVNLEGRSGMMIKSITVSTDKGYKDLYMRITVLEPVIPTRTDAERAQDMEIAKADRQAVFKGDCVNCHVKPGAGKYGPSLYNAVCGICHDVANRASMVPDLHNLKTPTNEEFWRTWTAHGKPGSLMPAFSTSDGGSLTDMQIATLAAYLSQTIPSQPVPAVTNPPAK
jgi:mono/diheme cytochrome c family protein